MTMISHISVVGLGKLGTPLCAVLASKGFNIVGVDCNEEVISLLNKGKTHLQEPGVQQLLDRYKTSIRVTANYADAVLNSDVTFLIVPTPSESNGFFSNHYLLQAIESLSQALQNKITYHLIVVVSTVMPGSMDTEIKCTLEKLTHRTIGKDIGLCYSPEFIALGNIVNNMLHPDMVLIGESDSQAGNMLESIYSVICENNPPIMRMNLINAEITKIAVNTFVTTKISFANMLSELCDKLPNADVDVVTEAMGIDSRIGKKYLKAATPYGGPCFPRDNIAFSNFSGELGVRADIAEATDAINRYQLQRIVSIVKQHDTMKKVGILGLSYKPFTDVIDESTGIKLANLLCELNYNVSVYDPMAMQAAKNFLNTAIYLKETLQACVDKSDILIISTDWPQFYAQLTADLVARTSSRRVIIDIWRILPREEFCSIADLYYFGYGQYLQSDCVLQ